MTLEGNSFRAGTGRADFRALRVRYVEVDVSLRSAAFVDFSRPRRRPQLHADSAAGVNGDDRKNAAQAVDPRADVMTEDKRGEMKPCGRR